MAIPYFKTIMLGLMVIVLASCGEHEQNKSSHTITVQRKPLTTSLFYSGIVQPLKTVVVTSPAEGVVAEKWFRFGDVVKKNQLLFTIFSDSFEEKYKEALMQYIKAKTEFNQAKGQLAENQFLHKKQLISDDDFKMKQTNFYTSQLSLLQAKETLAALLKRLELPNMNFYNLSIEEIDKITEALHLEVSSKKLRVLAPEGGVILLPIKSEGSDSQPIKISKGESVKQNEVLAMVGDMRGLMIHIAVNELDVNQLKVGQKVKVVGTALRFESAGFISGMDRQGVMGQGGVPMFSVEITVPKLTAAEQQAIHIGMSVKVEIYLASGSVLSVPIGAVYEKNGVPYLRLNEKGVVREVPIKTGAVTQDSVVIESGLNIGDQVVIND